MTALQAEMLTAVDAGEQPAKDLPGGAGSASASGNAGHPLLAGIPIAGLTERLSRKLEELLTGTPANDGDDEAEF